MKILTCDYCGRGLGRTHGVRCCGRRECREKWLHDDAERNRTRAALAVIRDENSASRARSRQTQETIDAFRADIEAMRATRGVTPEAVEAVPHGECRVCGKPLTHRRMHYCSDACHVSALRARIARWTRTHPDPVRGHCPVCGVKLKPGHRYCSDPCMHEWWRVEYVKKTLRDLEKAMSRASGRDDKEKEGDQ